MKESEAAGLRIGVVAQELEGEPTGVGRYLAGLLAGVAEAGAARERRDEEWILFFRGAPEASLEPRSPPGGPRFRAVFDRRPAARAVSWELLRLPRLVRRWRPDLLFSPAYSLPLGTGVPGVVALHDLSFEHLPGELRWRERWRRRLLARSAARRARRVLVPTEAMARDVAWTYGLPRERMGVVPLGVDPRFGRDGEPDADRRRLAAVGVEPPFLLAAGSILPRRRLDLVIAAFSALASRHPGLTLVIAGPDRLPDPRLLRRWIDGSDSSARIRALGFVDDELLAALYRGGELLVYLSTYEGWGLPPFEALAAGTPAVVAPGLALDELWPAYPFRCRELTVEEVARVTELVLTAPAARRRVVEEAGGLLADLSWRRVGESFLQELEVARGASVR